MQSTARAARGTAPTSVRLLIAPAPASVSESRQILRVIQRFGEVVAYKNLKYQPTSGLYKAANNTFAAFRNPESAQELLKASPLRFTLERIQEKDEEPEKEESEAYLEGPRDIEDELPKGPEDTSQIASEELLRRPATLLNDPVPRPKPNDAPKRTRPTQPNDEAPLRTEFKVSADIWHGKQTDFLERSQFWGPFEIDTRSRIQQDLKMRVPIRALSDIRPNKKEKPLRIIRKQQDDLASRMSVRQFYELSKTSSPELLAYNAPLSTGREPFIQPRPDGPPSIPPDDPRNFLLRELKQPRKPLGFAEPPGNYINTMGKDNANLAGPSDDPELLRRRYWRNQTAPLEHESISSIAQRQNTTASPPLTNHQTQSRQDSQHGALQRTHSFRDPFQMPTGQTSASTPQYGSLWNPKLKKKNSDLEEDDLAKIDADLRKGSLG